MPVLPAVRRLVARRPWVQWVAIAAMSVGLTATVADAMAGLEAERSAWGAPVRVWVATEDVGVGDPIVADTLTIPAAVRPASAVDTDEPVAGARARQAIGRGEILVALDVWTPDDELALAPDGWLVAPVEESPRSGAGPGERVQVVSDGFVLADDGVVVGSVDDVTLVAVPAVVAPLLPAASATTAVTLLRIP